MEQNGQETAITVANQPIFRIWTNLGAHVTERGVTTGFAVARELRGEVKTRVRDAIDLTESTLKGLTTVVRRIVDHLDTFTGDTLSNTESAIVATVRRVQTSAIEASQGAAKLGEGWIGRSDHQAA